VLSGLPIGSTKIQAQSPTTPPLLTEQEAVEIARTANRETKKTALDIDRAAQSILEAKTNYFPQSSINVTSGYPLGVFSFTLPKAALGTYPATGPIPATNTSITTSQNFAEMTFAFVAQPLSQLYKIHLGVEIARSERAMAVESTRQQSQSVTDQVRQSYHQICILEAQLIADETQEKALEEALRIAENNFVQGTALEADKLQAKAARRNAIPRQRMKMRCSAPRNSSICSWLATSTPKFRWSIWHPRPWRKSTSRRHAQPH